MKKSAFFFALFIFISAAVVQTASAQKIAYHGALKDVQFDYFKNWTLVEEQGAAIVKMDGKGDTFFQIASEPRTQSIDAVLKEAKKQMPGLRKTTFNGYEAYYDQGMYIFFRGNRQYMVMWMNESGNKTYEQQLKAMVESVRLK